MTEISLSEGLFLLTRPLVEKVTTHATFIPPVLAHWEHTARYGKSTVCEPLC